MKDRSIYKTQAAWNQDRPHNPRLVRNTPDLQMALRKKGASLILTRSAGDDTRP